MEPTYHEIKKKVILALENKLDKKVIQDDYIPKINLEKYTFMQQVSLINRLIELGFYSDGKGLLDLIDENSEKLNYENRLFLGLSYMKLGERKGFYLYKNRIYCPGCNSCNNQYRENLKILDGDKFWQGQKTDNKKILILAEQGHGDFIMWIRYLLFFKNTNINLIVHSYAKKIIPLCHKVLSYCAGQNSLSITDVINSDYDYWTYMGDLTHTFNMAMALPGKAFPYIEADSQKVNLWQNRLKNTEDKIVCVNLSGADDEKDPRKINLDEIEELFSIPGYKFININKNIPINHSNVINFDNLDSDSPYVDTLALMAISYKIISSDTSIIHFAGAMDLKSILILPLYAEWRWQRDDKSTVWYPSITIIRKNKVDNLVNAIKDIL